MNNLRKKIVALTSGIGFYLITSLSHAVIIPSPPQINAKGYLLIDAQTGKVIAEGNADAQLAPASLTKMMTSYIIGKELAMGNIKLTDMVTVSEEAWAQNPKFEGSSLMWIEPGKEVSVADLNRGIIIQSGNDACVAMAEHVAGGEDAFVQMMNAYAEQLGMFGTKYMNSHGLPHPDQFTTPRDMALLSKALIEEVPEEYAVYKEKKFKYNNIETYNRNDLLWDKSLDVDGIKTGHTEEAGYSLVSSATKGEMRLISVVMGTESKRARKVESKKLLNYGFRFFETITPYKAGASFAEHRIYMGDKETVSLGIMKDTPITIPRGQRKNLKANFELEKKIQAPIAKGDVVGKVFLQLDGEDVAEYPLVALHDVKEGGMMSRFWDYIQLQFAGEN